MDNSGALDALYQAGQDLAASVDADDEDEKYDPVFDMTTDTEQEDSSTSPSGSYPPLLSPSSSVHNP